MAWVATLSPVEIDIFLSSASPGQQAIVRTLRDIITRRASGLAERVNTGKELIELKSYLLFEGPGGTMVFAIGLTAARTVTVHLMPYDGSRELHDRHGAALRPFLVGKSIARFADPAELPAEAIAAIADAAPGYLQRAAVTPARPKRWGRRRGAAG
jgi:hypothetical protein